MSKSFDPTKPVMTRIGQPARIVCTDRNGSLLPIVALVGGRSGETLTAHYPDGRSSSNAGGSTEVEHPLDLVNVPETVTRYAIFKQTFGYDTLAGAEKNVEHLPGSIVRGEFVDGVLTKVEVVKP